MKTKLIADIENAQLKQDVPDFSPGDTVVVQVRVVEGTRERLQAYEGVVIGIRNRGINSALPSEKFLTALVLSVLSRLTALSSIASQLSDVVMFGRRNSTICVS